MNILKGRYTALSQLFIIIVTSPPLFSARSPLSRHAKLYSTSDLQIYQMTHLGWLQRLGSCEQDLSCNTNVTSMAFLLYYMLEILKF
jgi:hypothetical protein